MWLCVKKLFRKGEYYFPNIWQDLLLNKIIKLEEKTKMFEYFM